MKWDNDLSHMSNMCGLVGRLQTISSIPVVAGDEISLGMAGVWRLSPLRRQLAMDALVDQFVFYAPHRHTLGTDWVDFLKAGVDEAVTFTGISANAFGSSCLGAVFTPASEDIPLFLQAGNNQIWNNYFRHPTTAADVKADTDLPGTFNDAWFGWPVGYLPSIWNTAIDSEVTNADYEVSAVTVLDLFDFAAAQSRLETERRREWFARRYRDVLGSTYGTSINIDAEQRPQLVAHDRFWMSGFDIEGTDDASLGSFVGKAQTVQRFGFPRRLFPEHGILWVMACLRFPPVHVHERHYLYGKQDWTYQEIAGDPLIANLPPATQDLGDYFVNNGISWAADVGIQPYGQHYRHHPNVTHLLYSTQNNWALYDTQITTKAISRYHTDEFQQAFLNETMGHWQFNGRLDVDVKRTVPPAESSIFAGTR